MKPIKTRQRNSWLPQERNILAREVYAQLQKYLRYLQSSAKNTKELVSTDIIEEKPNRSGREKIIELLSGAARGLELHGVNELKDRLHTLANTAYGHPSEVDKIDKAMRKITHHRVIKGSEKVRKQRAAKSAWEWANQNCR